MGPEYSEYDFDADPEYQQWLRRVEVADPAVLERAKQRWFKKNIDPDFDTQSASTAAPQSGGSRATGVNQNNTAPQASAAKSAQQPPNGSGGGGGGTGTGTSTSSASVLSRLRGLSRQINVGQLLFFSHLALVALCLAYLTPFLGRGTSRTAYQQFMLLGAASHAIKVFNRFGKPSLRPFPAALTPWLAQASATTDFQYAVICSAFLNQRPMVLVMIPVLVLAVYHSFAYAALNFSHTRLWQQYGRRAHGALIAKQRDAQLLNAGIEIATGFLLIAMLLTPSRAILLTVLFWQILRSRFHTPDCSAYHRQVWALIDDRTRGVRQTAPVLQTPIGYAQRWFCST